MENRLQAESMVAWGLAAFQTMVFVMLILTASYMDNSLGKTLSGLDTVLGLGVFLVLWAITWYCTNRAVQEVTLNTSRGTQADVLLGAGVKWGGWAGAYFLAAIIAVSIVVGVATEGLPKPQVIVGLLIYASFFVVVAEFVAYLVGAVIGLVFAMLAIVFWEISLVLIGWRQIAVEETATERADAPSVL